MQIQNPKRYIAATKERAGWVDYYAGYSIQFAKTILETSGLPQQALIADPWNGSGTTIEAASILGFKGVGFDINPVMLVVARARMLRGPSTPSIKPLMRKIIDGARDQAVDVSGDDPLSLWFKPNGVRSIRRIEASLQELLLDFNSYKSARERNLANDLSDLAAFFYNALFRSVRKSLGRFHTSNPTWIRVAKQDRERISVGLGGMCDEFRRQVCGMLASLEGVSFCHLNPDYALETASSVSLPLTDQSVDMILSSPPYCTRIDYAVTTLPELAVLGYSTSEVRSLRNEMIGTSTIANDPLVADRAWGKTCYSLLRKIKTHRSKASAGYYYKNHLQYFARMADSLAECRRILKPDALCVLVVQDSYYKDVHNDLPKIITEMAHAESFALKKRSNFRQERTMAGVNPGVRGYRADFGATESVLVFKRSR